MEILIKIPDMSDLVSRTALNTKISEVENKVRDNFKYLTIQEFNSGRKFCSKINASLVSNTDFDNKQIINELAQR